MIGNDIVDLELSRLQSNWQRKGFLEKIFTIKEQEIILENDNSEQMIWNLWTRKEAAYKIFNRSTQIRAFIPLQLECRLFDVSTGIVCINHQIYHTQTEQNDCSIYTVAASKKEYFSKIVAITSDEVIVKENGIPFLRDKISDKKNPVSITHHGRFWNGITLVV
jgi:phosphopantetheine--protein transferase-like protein